MDIDILGSYPIILDGETVGELTVSREGLFWGFDAKCEMRGEIVRLSVYGNGMEAYLGIMEPIGDMLCLTKKLSRSALAAFPAKISHAGQKGEVENFEFELSRDSKLPGENEQYHGEFPLSHFIKDNSHISAPPDDDLPACETVYHPLSELNWRPCPLPCSLFSGLEAKKLCSSITGAYLSQDGDVYYLAVPEELTKTFPESGAVRFVDKIYFSENAYLICIIINGKSVSEL
ncbi:MAG: hypothetical protein EOM51_03505 [Clostridia bacterium]|nr:hypothetical protein [Clostridia bacterium]